MRLGLEVAAKKPPGGVTLHVSSMERPETRLTLTRLDAYTLAFIEDKHCFSRIFYINASLQSHGIVQGQASEYSCFCQIQVADTPLLM